VKEEITYFTEIGIVNTDETLRIAKEKALKDSIETIIVASTRGHTIRRALELFEGSGTKFIVVGSPRRDFPSDLHRG
jgi:hypothetical protein